MTKVTGWKKHHSGFSETWITPKKKGEDYGLVDVRPISKDKNRGYSVDIYPRGGSWKQGIHGAVRTKTEGLKFAKRWIKNHPKGR